ncbi:AmmeMemoRadiSam system protein B [Thermodesulfovibrionales bacterium]|nr:AmmeMemoRadiSam system protein B [Thermodesulfovibrionales bacterium]
MKRSPAVAGQFYYGNAQRLKGQVKQYIIEGAAKKKVIGILSPHAGLVYSGHVAGAVYSSIQFPETFIFLGPNHSGVGSMVSIMTSGEWEIPSAAFHIDEGLGKDIIQRSHYIAEDIQSHIHEHSIEVQLPFVSHFSDRVKIVPINIMRASLEECKEIGDNIAQAIKEVDYYVVIVASSDMSHYVSDAFAKRLDGLVINEILDLNPEGLYNIVRKERISMCGLLPATIMLHAAKRLGAKEARLIKYATSGDVSGDYEHVVGYAGVIIE